MRFFLDNNVDARVGRVLRQAGHECVHAHEVGLGGDEPAEDDEITVWADDRGFAVVTHDREFTARRRRNTLGLHIRLTCDQPDGPAIVREFLDELVSALERRATWWCLLGLRVSRCSSPSGS